MFEALVDGADEAAALADLAKRRTRSKIAQLIEALNGRFTEHHGFLAQLHLERIGRLAVSPSRLML